MSDPVRKCPLVSIVIPCYNAEFFVDKAIESALSQSYSNFEVIVVDDGSTDESLRRIREFGEAVRWETGKNRGGAAARNVGLARARGELVQFLDADDLLLPTKLERQAPHALLAGSKSLSICKGQTSGGNAYFDWQYSRECDPKRDPVEFVLGGVLPTTAPLHFRENLLAVGGFDESLPCAQEFDLHLRLVSSGLQLVQLREKLFVVNQQPDSVSSDSMKVLRQKHYILGKATQLVRSHSALTTNLARSFAVAYARAATALELGGYPEEAGACRRDALALWPNAEVYAWTTRWRPLVLAFGSVRTAKFRRWIKSFRAALSQ